MHATDIVHGSIGSGSFMANTLDDSRASALLVKLDNLGFGQVFTGASGPSSGLEKGKRSDQEALAITFCELAFCALRRASLRTRTNCCACILAAAMRAHRCATERCINLSTGANQFAAPRWSAATCVACAVTLLHLAAAAP